LKGKRCIAEMEEMKREQLIEKSKGFEGTETYLKSPGI